MTIAGMVKTSLVDFPGKLSCVLFTPGCNFDCFYCHNRQLLGSNFTTVPFEEVMDYLKKRAGLIGGIVITGGEPTLQEGIREAVLNIRKLGYKTKLDTNGSFPEKVESFLREGLFDYYAIDYKAPRSRYREICGPADPDKVLETIKLLSRSGVSFEVRTTVIPQLKPNDLLRMAGELPLLPRYVLNRYRKPEVYKIPDRAQVEAPPYTQAEIDGFASMLRDIQPNTVT
ncbi:MAG: anaerobic ribonucleoside-triphosphate reductase activating protein [Oscillospiraceae bacterium]|jgi:pyruvate formate lyase activating enzyme